VEGVSADVGTSVAKPPKFDAIIVHSLSRFFRDHLELGIHDKELRKNKVKLISVTQLTDDDAHGELIRTINAVFDGYQSKETSKHTLRSMLENARQGFHNGSKPPFGFVVKDIKLEGRKDAKKVLEIALEEAEVISKMFHLYLDTSNGVKGVAAYLNERNILRRGNFWGSTTIHDILTNHLYMGERVFNKNHWKTGELKPESEWIKVPIEPIVSEDLYSCTGKAEKPQSCNDASTALIVTTASNRNPEMWRLWCQHDNGHRQRGRGNVLLLSLFNQNQKTRQVMFITTSADG
jgi:hypothetical protein